MKTKRTTDPDYNTLEEVLVIEPGNLREDLLLNDLMDYLDSSSFNLPEFEQYLGTKLNKTYLDE